MKSLALVANFAPCCFCDIVSAHFMEDYKEYLREKENGHVSLTEFAKKRRKSESTIRYWSTIEHSKREKTAKWCSEIADVVERAKNRQIADLCGGKRLSAEVVRGVLLREKGEEFLSEWGAVPSASVIRRALPPVEERKVPMIRTPNEELSPEGHRRLSQMSQNW